MAGWSIRQLKEFLESRDVDLNMFNEKHEFIAEVRRLKREGVPAKQATTGSGSAAGSSASHATASSDSSSSSKKQPAAAARIAAAKAAGAAQLAPGDLVGEKVRIVNFAVRKELEGVWGEAVLFDFHYREYHVLVGGGRRRVYVPHASLETA